MEAIKLESMYRSNTTKGQTNQLRRQGYVTGSVFGHNTESVSIAFKFTDLADKIKQSSAGITSLIDLEIDGAPTNVDGKVIIKEFTKDPLTHKLMDVEFQRISMEEKIHVAVPIELVGNSVCTQSGGTVEELVDELEVICLPDRIPSKIQVDISHQAIGDVIRVGDINLGEGIDILDDPEDVIVSCIAPRVIEEISVEETQAELSKAPEAAS